jgi:hypothetical protein
VYTELVGDDAVAIDLKAYPENIGKALIRSLRRAVNSGRSLVARRVASDLGIRASDAREAIATDVVAKGTHEVEGSIAASRTRLPLIRFRARQTRQGVTYRYGSQRKVFKHAFIVKLKSGHDGVHEGVFTRKLPSERTSPRGWTKNLPIKERAGPSIAWVVRRYRQEGLAAAQASFDKTFAHELGRLAGARVTVEEGGGDA